MQHHYAHIEYYQHYWVEVGGVCSLTKTQLSSGCLYELLTLFCTLCACLCILWDAFAYSNSLIPVCYNTLYIHTLIWSHSYHHKSNMQTANKCKEQMTKSQMRRINYIQYLKGLERKIGVVTVMPRSCLPSVRHTSMPFTAWLMDSSRARFSGFW